MKRKTTLIIITIILVIIIAITIRIIPVDTKIQQCPSYDKILVDCNALYIEPVCWNDNKTYDNSCIACYMYWQKYYTEWKCTKNNKINLFNFIINKIK